MNVYTWENSMKSREKKVKVGAAKKLSAYPSDGFVPNAAVTT